MEKKINIAELLTDCPKGMELDCTMYENVKFDGIETGESFPIRLVIGGGEHEALTEFGRWNNSDNAKCVIYPKDKATWEGFHRPFVDGDIVAIDSFGGSQVFIFEEYIRGENDYAHCYLMLDDNGALDLERGKYYVERFASREEQERLFEAIKEKGYRWDPVNNTLERLVEPKFKVGDIIQDEDGYKVKITKVNIEDERYGYESMTTKVTANIVFSKQDKWELVPNKFDIATLKPFDKVLARDTDNSMWIATLFSHLRGMTFYTVGGWYNQCIPFKGNEYLRGKTDDCDEFYKTWE